MMLREQTRSAKGWLTDRAQEGAVLDPNATVDASGKTVLDVLKEKLLKMEGPDKLSILLHGKRNAILQHF